MPEIVTPLLRRWFPVHGILCVAAWLTGCVPAGPADPPQPVAVSPSAKEQGLSNPGSEAGPWAFVRDTQLYLTLPSSSTCPAHPASISAGPGASITVEVRVDPSADGLCTADMTLLSYPIPSSGSETRIQLTGVADTPQSIRIARVATPDSAR